MDTKRFGVPPDAAIINHDYPMISPVNASRAPSRVPAHHSGPGRLARPYPVEDSHLLSFASFAWRTPLLAVSCPMHCSNIRTKQVAFRLDDKLLKRVDTYAKKMAVATPGLEYSRVDAVRFLLTHALNDLENSKGKK